MSFKVYCVSILIEIILTDFSFQVSFWWSLCGHRLIQHKWRVRPSFLRVVPLTPLDVISNHLVWVMSYTWTLKSPLEFIVLQPNLRHVPRLKHWPIKLFRMDLPLLWSDFYSNHFFIIGNLSKPVKTLYLLQMQKIHKSILITHRDKKEIGSNSVSTGTDYNYKILNKYKLSHYGSSRLSWSVQRLLSTKKEKQWYSFHYHQSEIIIREEWLSNHCDINGVELTQQKV